MAGEAKTDQVLLSSATVMIGPKDKLFTLNPDDHSIGLAKNVRVTADVAFTELTQGVTNQIVQSVQTKLDAKISAEVYEYTAKNLAYAAGLDGSTMTSAASTYLLASDATGASPTTIALEAGKGADFQANDWIVLQDTTEPDRVHVGQVASVATDTLTLTTGTGIDTGKTFSHLTTTAFKVNKLDIGVNFTAQPTFGAKIVGLFPSTNEPVTLLFPKVKITKGIDVAFETQNFANMPFEFTPYVPVSTDTYYSQFKSKLFGVFKQ